VWWFSPHYLYDLFLVFMLKILLSGRLHRVEKIFILSFSPLYSFADLLFFCLLNVGEITQGRIELILSFSPLFVSMILLVLFFVYSDDGEIHRRVFYSTLVLPPVILF